MPTNVYVSIDQNTVTIDGASFCFSETEESNTKTCQLCDLKNVGNNSFCDKIPCMKEERHDNTCGNFKTTAQ